MCEGMGWCANPYIQLEPIEPDCGAYSEWAQATISLRKRGEIAGQLTGDYIAVEWMHEERSWSLWTACNFPAALARLLGTAMLGHDASDAACPSIAEMIMDAVTDGLLDGPRVRVALDGAELRVQLLLADTGMTKDAAEASCGWWEDG